MSPYSIVPRQLGKECSKVDKTELLALVGTFGREAVLVADHLGRTIWVNDAFEKLTGYEKWELVGLKPGDLLHGYDSCPDAKRKMGEAIRCQQQVNVEIINYTKSGTAYWTDLDISPKFDSDDRFICFVGVQRDITQAKHAAAAQKDLVAYIDALDRLGIVSITDRAGKMIMVNDNFCAISGYSREEMIGQDHRLVRSGYHPKSFFQDLWKTVDKGKAWHGEICNRTKNGELFWTDTTIVPVLDEGGLPDRYVCIRYDVTNRKQNEIELHRIVRQDALTGLLNRSYWAENMQVLLEDRRIAGGMVAMIALDHFKQINDTVGHSAGDIFLKEISQAIKRNCRQSEIIGRFGGDEFVIAFPGICTLDEAEIVLDRLRKALSRSVKLGDRSVYPSISIGTTFWPEDGMETDVLLKNADLAVFEVKRSRRGDRAHFDSSTMCDHTEKFDIECALRQAILDRSFDFALQPQLDLRTGEVRGFEALIRWKLHGRPVPPDSFIPIAEEAGLIGAIGDIILDMVCANFREFRNSGVELGMVSINVAPQQLVSPDFFETVNFTLSKYGLRPSDIEIEITETSLIGHRVNDVKNTLAALSEFGISLALDDFGTGYSSLTHLKEFPVNYIKIDKSFVIDMDKQEEDHVLVEAISALASTLGLAIIAEGVETEIHHSMLTEMGCHYGQGYLYAKPLKVEEVRQFLSKIRATSDCLAL